MAKRHHRKLKAADKTQIHWVGKLKTEFLEPTLNNFLNPNAKHDVGQVDFFEIIFEGLLYFHYLCIEKA